MAGFDNPLWRQVQKIELDRDGTMRVPAKANAEEGIVLGDGLTAVPRTGDPASGRRPGRLARLRSLHTRRR